jgi:hypothetical protein
MSPRTAARASSASLGAMLIALVLVGPTAAAVTWGTPKQLSAAEWATAAGLSTPSGSVAVAVYTEGHDPSPVYVRRSADSGATWSAPLLLSNDSSWRPAIAGRGTRVDVVWARAGRVRYRSSADGGATFAPTTTLSPAGQFAANPQVARGPGGRVAVVWERGGTGAVRVRVSTDGGTSFAPARTLTNASDLSPASVAIGKGVIYFAYAAGSERIRVRRSLDAGASWSAPQRIRDKADAFDGVRMTADGKHAYIAYTAPNTAPNWWKVRYRRTTDRGTSWSRQRDLSPASWTASNPRISLQGGTVRAAFERCTPEWDICVDQRVFYRESSGGITWAPSQRASPSLLAEAMPGGVGFADKVLVLYSGYGPDGVYVRPGTP